MRKLVYLMGNKVKFIEIVGFGFGMLMAFKLLIVLDVVFTCAV